MTQPDPSNDVDTSSDPNNAYSILGTDEDTDVEDNLNKEINNYVKPSSTVQLSKTNIKKAQKSVKFHQNTKTDANHHTLASASHISTCSTPSRPNSIRMVIDSGATDHMSPFAQMFEQITYFDPKHQPVVLMGDDSTTLPIAGHGYISFTILGKLIRTHALYIPQMGHTALYSVKQHMKSQGCYFHAEAGNSELAFPTFLCTPRINMEIDILISPNTNNTMIPDFDEYLTIQRDIKNSKSTISPRSSDATYALIKADKAQYLPKSEYNNHAETVSIKKLLPNASLPTRSTQGSIGFDVRSIATTTIKPGELAIIPTGLATSLPKHMYLRIASRSSLALQHINVEGGVVDSDYRGEIQIMLRNQGSTPFKIWPNQKIAQFIFEMAATPMLHVTTTLPASQRNKGVSAARTQPIMLVHKPIVPVMTS
jgi:dUTP pyrophosphatase